MRALLAFSLCTLLLSSCSRADSWGAPTLKVIASPDGSALLRISPGRWGEEGSHATATVLKFDAASGGYQKVTEFALRNSAAPHAAVITNSAQFIVTFDDWAEIGRTGNVVVVYRGTGEFVRSWSLADIFSEEERKKFTSSVSSTWWRGDVELLENRVQSPVVFIRPETHLALLVRDRKVESTLVFDVVKMTFEKK